MNRSLHGIPKPKPLRISEVKPLKAHKWPFKTSFFMPLVCMDEGEITSPEGGQVADERHLVQQGATSLLTNPNNQIS